MGGNGTPPKIELKTLTAGPMAIELIPDGVSVIVLFHRPGQAYQFYLSREELRGIADWVLQRLEHL